MNTIKGRSTILAAALAVALPAAGAAEQDLGTMKREMRDLKERMQQLESEMKSQEQRAAAEHKQVEAVRKDVKAVSRLGTEWVTRDSTLHIAGYAAVGYTDTENGTDSFNLANFNPIFHFLYKDKVLWEAELEFKVQNDGSTKTALEYTTLDYFLNDYMTIVGGKFLSPAGYFIQNLHPAWINKLPSKPAGFSGGQAAPESDLGFALRGGFPAGGPVKVNYSVYVANGPHAEGAAGGGGIELIEAEAVASDSDGDKVWGGRVGVLPIPGLEIGLSGVTGGLGVVDAGGVLANDNGRDYRLLGVDASYHRRNLELRGEYIRQRVGAQSTSPWPDSALWAAWYTQAAYRFAPTHFEAVVRYGEYNAPDPLQDQRQWAIGMNYLVGPGAIAKVAYEFNDGRDGSTVGDDRVLLQFAFGF